MQKDKKAAPAPEVQSVSDLMGEFKTLKKYASLGFINQENFTQIENEFKKRILALCGIEFLKPGQHLLTEIQ